MTVKEVLKLAEHIQYKPSFKIRIRDSYDYAGVEFGIKMDTVDVNNGTPGPIQLRIMLTYEAIERMNEREMIHFIYNLVRGMEMHELDEWFKYRNINLKAPHEGIATYTFTQDTDGW